VSWYVAAGDRIHSDPDSDYLSADPKINLASAGSITISGTSYADHTRKRLAVLRRARP
jgi:hypothetical protein